MLNNDINLEPIGEIIEMVESKYVNIAYGFDF